MSHVGGSVPQLVFSNSSDKNKLQKTEMEYPLSFSMSQSIDCHGDDDNNTGDDFLHPIWQAHL